MTNPPAPDERTVQSSGTQPAAASPAPAAASPTKGKSDGASADAKLPIEPVKLRRRLIWTLLWGFLGAISLMLMRFFFPRTIFEPKSVFTIGNPTDFGPGVETKFQQQYRIWVVKKPDRLFVIYARCTHLGCTPDWKESENKFKCPCHGSGYDSDGINFEGPAPRPMDRAHVELNAQGQIVVDVNRLYKCEKGKECQFETDGAFLLA